MAADDQTPKTQIQKQIEWSSVKRVLVVRLRSIGDTVLATPSLTALKRFLPNAEIDILLEDWVAPLLEGHDAVDNILTVGRTFTEKLKTARKICKRNYDVVFNLHGGSTSTFLTYATGAKHRVGYGGYRYSLLYTDLLSSSADFWQRSPTHSAEQQLALLGFVGVPVDDRPRSTLTVIADWMNAWPLAEKFALIHPAAAFETKQWRKENFARVADYLFELGIEIVTVAAKNEEHILKAVALDSKVPMTTFSGLSLPEVTALASRATLFVGNDSGIAHIAAAVNTPAVVIFGSSNRDHWYPWTDAPNEVVFNEFHCQPCAGYECKEFGDPKCIKSVNVEQVIAAVDRVLSRSLTVREG